MAGALSLYSSPKNGDELEIFIQKKSFVPCWIWPEPELEVKVDNHGDIKRLFSEEGRIVVSGDDVDKTLDTFFKLCESPIVDLKGEKGGYFEEELLPYRNNQLLMHCLDPSLYEAQEALFSEFRERFAKDKEGWLSDYAKMLINPEDLKIVVNSRKSIEELRDIFIPKLAALQSSGVKCLNKCIDLTKLPTPPVDRKHELIQMKLDEEDTGRTVYFSWDVPVDELDTPTWNIATELLNSSLHPVRYEEKL